MRKVGVKGRLVAVTALSVVIGLIVYHVPLIKYLVWLNAAAISQYVGMGWAFVPLACIAFLGIVAVPWGVLWKLGSSVYDRD